MDGLDEYRALVRKVDAFVQQTTARCEKSLRCQAGCSACCEVELAISPVEAEAVAAHLARMEGPAREALALRAAGEPGRCPMLDERGLCRIYEARPLVCRTQGLPLRYPEGTVPAESVRARAADGGELTWCPLNFTEGAPASENVLDAEAVDRLLALVNQRWSLERGRDPLERTPLREIARGSTLTR